MQTFKYAFFCLATLHLAACATKPEPIPEKKAVYFKSIDDAAKGGLTPKEMEIIHLMLQEGFSKPIKSRNFVSKIPDVNVTEILNPVAKDVRPRSLRIANAQGLDIGLAYFRETDQFYVFDANKLGSHDYAEFERTEDGFVFTLIEGCVHSSVEVVTSHGKPYWLK